MVIETPNANKCPARVKRELDDYLRGIPPGSFVLAVLENNLLAAVRYADPKNLAALPHIVAFLCGRILTRFWGSPTIVQDHLDACRRQRARKAGGPS